MHLEGPQRHVRLFTILAAEGFLHLITLGGRTVELLMLGETREGGVGLLTVGTLITWRRRLVLFAGRTGQAGRGG